MRKRKKTAHERRTHRGPDGVRHPEGHEAVSAVAREVVGVVQQTEGGVRLDDPRGPERVVEATQGDFGA